MNQVYLKNLRHQPPALVTADLREISPAELRSIDQQWTESRDHWRKSLRERQQDAPESDTWTWAEKPFTLPAGDAVVIAVACDERVQGLMLVDRRPSQRRSRRPSHGSCRLYVDYLESAPWNQRGYADELVVYGGVGSALIYTAIRVSEEAGCMGCIGLHALPEAEGFYRHLGFEDLGRDAEEELHYFELSAEAARILLGGGDDEAT